MNLNANNRKVDIRIVEAESTAKAENFESEVTPHLAILLKIAVKMSRNPMDAEDLVQDTLVRAFRFWNKYEPGTNCRAWLFRILRNQFVNEYRVRSRRPRIVDIDALDDTYLFEQSSYYTANKTPEEIVLERYLDDDIVVALQRLRIEFREIAVLYYLRGCSYQQISDTVKLSIGTVKSRLYRSRKRLRVDLLEFARKNRYVSTRH